MSRTDPSPTPVASGNHGQQHSISVYLEIQGLLFILNMLSYLVDCFRMEGLTRWVLIVMLVIARAGLIASVFTHMTQEQLALVYTILIPSLALLVPMVLMAAEAYHTFGMRAFFFH